MSLLGLRLLERVHGHVGWLAVAALLHPAIVLRRRRRRAGWAVGSATGLVTVTGLLGAWIYPAYRVQVKQPLFLASPRTGWLFESKEHLAVGAIALAWAGLLVHAAGPQTGDPALRDRLDRLAWSAFVAAWLLALVAAALGTMVAARLSF